MHLKIVNSMSKKCKTLNILSVILIIGIACKGCKTNNFSKEHSGIISKKIAIAYVTDLHCNDQNYPKIGNEVKKLCKTNGVVILVVNGDIFTKYDPGYVATIDNDGMGKDLDGFHKKHFFPSGGLADFFINLMENNSKISVIFNIGNHELMFGYPHLLACFFKRIKDSVNNRFYVVSNLEMKKPDVEVRWEGEPENGLVDFVKPFITVEKITFIGYCTPKFFENIIWNEKSLYGYARDHFYNAMEGETRHVQRFVYNIRNATRNNEDNSILIVLSHEGIGVFSGVWKKVKEDSKNNGNYLSALKQRIIVTGHIHGQSDDCCGINEIIVAPKALGCTMEIVELSFTDSNLVGTERSGKIFLEKR
jgi:2',3'-cyclic-nucleotide 2'-phosphodiesterase (5'-nucleotidase family)